MHVSRETNPIFADFLLSVFFGVARKARRARVAIFGAARNHAHALRGSTGGDFDRRRGDIRVDKPTLTPPPMFV